MNPLRLTLGELRRLTASRLPAAAVLAVVLIPTLYAGLYLYANHDPYAGLSRVPAALVVADEGAQVDGETRNVGEDVADQLLDSGDFAWEQVDERRAAEGVRDGDYDFALTVPRDFSRSLTGALRLDPEQARLQLTTNDANSYLSTTIADTVVQRVREAVASQVSEQAADQFLVGTTDVRGGLVDATGGARRLTDGASTAADGATRLSEGTDELSTGLDELSERTAALPEQSRELADGARQVAQGNARIAAIGDEVAGVSGDLSTAYAGARDDLKTRMGELGLSAAQQRALIDVYDGVGTAVDDVDARVADAGAQLDRLSSGADQVADGAERLADAAPQLSAGIDRAADGAREVDDGAGRLAAGLGRLESGSGELADGLHDAAKRLPVVDDDLRASIAQTLGDPVDVTDAAQTSAGSYGAGLAPFFLALATWIGGYVLFLLVRPLSARALAAGLSSARVAVAGWLTPAILGAAQVIVALGVCSLVVGIDVGDFARTAAFLLLVSATFVAIVHALNAWLGTAGQFLGLVLMVVQLVSAGGTFPWQTLPEPLHAVHHALPMTYAVDGLRQLMYGGAASLVGHDVLVLAAWLAAALAASTWAARRQRVWTPARIRPELSL